ncbi:flagellar basal-body MS-ring/collar protein FliF [Nocardioides caldifontis]|uniref:flagellar basal-body MS-ring/collar protein FliF n=1 Tax=Nocardioides caldifontis TaxID=2588938 RepID=UPI0011DF002C|nr:flagellar basal-body MS-ring/collar protein FliF [Nocardioides caldifontis]
MKDNVTRVLGRLQSTFQGFTSGQKFVAVIGTGALLLAGFMVFKWAATPSYAPLFSNLAAADASAIVEELDAQGVPYELSNGGATIMVPREQVYSTRISLSGEGLPTGSESGYSLLDDQGLSTSEFQEQTSYKRAMEGELAKTIEAIDGVETAVVHLAMPQKEVFSSEQAPTTASVMVKTRLGSTLAPEQVQAVVNMVSSSVEGLTTEKVTVTDSTGKLLSAPGGEGAASTRTQQVTDFENRLNTQVQSLLDRVLGPGNSAVQVRADLSFDKSVTETTRYFGNADTALSESETTEILEGGDPNAGAGGIVGPDSEMETGTTGGTSGQNYEKSSRTSDNAVNKEVSTVEAAPGGVDGIHVGIVVDPRSPSADAAEIQDLVTAALGIDAERGDTIEVSQLAFDRTAEEAAAAELEASEKAEKSAATWTLIRNGGLAGLLVLIALVAWIQSRRRAKARAQATEYVVEQLRQEQLERQQRAALEAPAMLALETAEASEEDLVREEISSLVERQPEDVAALLRGWLVENR